MEGKQEFFIRNQLLWLLPQRAIYWPAYKTLLIADVHLGKSTHFRKAGLAVPGTVAYTDINQLAFLVNQTAAERVIFLGDLFHSGINREWLLLESLITNLKNCEFVLIKGNHDILPDTVYQNSQLKIIEDELVIFPFLLTHHPPSINSAGNDLYRLCGHIHPGVQLLGRGGQGQKLACFYFGLHYGLLPAFGKFTGFHIIKPKLADTVYGVLPGKVMPLNIPANGGVPNSK